MGLQEDQLKGLVFDSAFTDEAKVSEGKPFTFLSSKSTRHLIFSKNFTFRGNVFMKHSHEYI